VKGSCPGCKKEILWGDVIRGVFGRAGQMEGNTVDDDIQESESEDDDEEDDIPITPRKKRVSGLVRLTGKPKTPTPKKPRTTKGRNAKSVKESSNVVSVDATDDEATPKPAAKRKPRGRPKKNAKIVDSRTEIGVPGVSRRTEDACGTLMMVPDSAGEANDVWVISSDDD
jgi:hypothetical protein